MKQEVNFLPLIEQRRQPLDALQMVAVVGAVALLLGLVSIWDGYRAGQLEAEVDALSQRQAEANQQVQEVSAELSAARAEADEDPVVASLRAELERRRATLSALDYSDPARPGFSPHLAGLARRAGDDIWLDRILLRDGGQRMHLVGHALDPERIPEFIAALRDEDVYGGKRFQRLAIDRTHRDRVRFELATRPEEAEE